MAVHAIAVYGAPLEQKRTTHDVMLSPSELHGDGGPTSPGGAASLVGGGPTSSGGAASLVGGGPTSPGGAASLVGGGPTSPGGAASLVDDDRTSCTSDQRKSLTITNV